MMFSLPSYYSRLQYIVVAMLDGGGGLKVVYESHTKVRCKNEH